MIGDAETSMVAAGVLSASEVPDWGALITQLNDELPLPAGIRPSLQALLGRPEGPDRDTVEALLDRL